MFAKIKNKKLIAEQTIMHMSCMTCVIDIEWCVLLAGWFADLCLLVIS